MYDILDPVDRWIGTPGASPVSFSSNKAPVAIDDALSVTKDDGPVSVAVLTNDFDPEGGALTLVSATAALGSAVAEADNTVTYTPPPGITGFDTVVYEVADDLNQRRSAQINVTISEPPLSLITQSDNTLLLIAGTGSFDLDVTHPAAFAGTTTLDTNALDMGPVNLSPPVVAGVPTPGQILTAKPGLWLYGTAAGLPARSWQWRRSGSDILGATLPSYTVQATDAGAVISVVEGLSDNFGQRFVESAGVSSSGANFQPLFDPGLMAWHDANDLGTLTETSNAVTAWSDKAGGAALSQLNAALQPETGARQVNGLNALDFDGNTHLSRTITLPVSGNVAVHMAVVVDAVDNEYDGLLSFDAATHDMQIDAGAAAQFDGRLNPAGIGSVTPFTDGPFSGPLILSLVFDATESGTAEIYVDGQLRGTMAYTAPLDSEQTLYVMTNRARNASFDGAFCELVITSDITNRADHHAYLAAKWGIS